MQYQQGDVLIWEDKIPSDATRRESRIIARGEATGHAHVVESEDVELFECDGTLYCRVISEKGATITHQEHGPVVLPQGEFRFGIVQEYDYDAAESRNVMD